MRLVATIVFLAAAVTCFARPRGAWEVSPATIKAGWQFEDGNASAADWSGNGNTATIYNTPTVVSGKIGNSVTLNGSTQYASVANSGSFSNQTMTICYWIKVTSPASQYVFDRGTPLNLGLATGKANFGWYDTAWREIVANTALTSDVWAHVALTYDGATFRAYFNGNADGTSSYTGAFPYSTAIINIGRRYNATGYLPGTFDDLRVYSGALLEGQIRAIYQAGR